MSNIGAETQCQPDQASSKSLPMAQREKYWEECSVDQKLDRIREMLMSLNSDQANIGAVIVSLMEHSHDHDGGLRVPLRHPDTNTSTLGYARDRAYSIRTERERERGWRGRG